jgi:hypothetical protein
MITPQALEQHGYRRREWNGGAVVEYWKAIQGDSRLSVRFGEIAHEPFRVWLFFPHHIQPLKHITTVEQVEQLHGLLVGVEDHA